MAKPTKEDASLLLQIMATATPDIDYQKALDWFVYEMNETNYDDFKKKYPQGSEGYKNFMTSGKYPELMGMLVSRELIHEDLIFDMWGDMMWEKAKPIIYGLRKDLGMPRLLENYELLASKYPEWAESHPPKAQVLEV